MFDAFRKQLLRWLRVPAEPAPPAGSPDSIRVFRAGPNLYQWTVIQWALKQGAAGIGLLIALAFFSPFHFVGVQVKAIPEWIRILWMVAEGATTLFFVVQLPLTYALLRLGYEMRWYIVTDRSLRIRSGTWSVEELTMTFANIQQVNLTQGPLQRFLGIADLEVTSAGGGGGRKQGNLDSQSSHAGRFQGVDNAEAIRTLILDRLRRYRDSGLGDPDDTQEHAGSEIEAAREVLAAATALRKAMSS